MMTRTIQLAVACVAMLAAAAQLKADITVLTSDFIADDIRSHFNGTGFGADSLVMYELVANGSEVLTGSAPVMSENNYLGFSGGGFDIIRIRDNPSKTGVFHDGTDNALTLDNIETAVPIPEPTTFTLWLLLGGIGWVVRRRRRKL